MIFNLDLAWQLVPSLLQGTVVTLLLLLPTFVVGFVFSIPLALAGRSNRRIVRWPVRAFTTFIRGAPQLVLLYLVYNGFALWGVVRETFLWDFFDDPYNCAVFAFTINHAAFLSEIWRGALAAIPKGIDDGCESLGLPKWVGFVKVRLPLAFRFGLSAYRNEVILFIKGTAAVGAITVFDILAFANEAVELTYDPFTPLVMAALVYWMITQLCQILFDRGESYLNRYKQRETHEKG